jgi:hypothetical protein
MGPFQSAKLVVADSIGLSKDALHVYVGLGAFLLAALILRVPLRDWRPLAVAFAVALSGEIWDLVEWTNRGNALQWDSAWHDLWNTMFWPAMLFALARWTQLLRR